MIAGAEPVLAGYFLAGYPDKTAFFDLIQKTRNYIDVFEIGYPSENPSCDGDIIQKAHRDVFRRGLPDIDWFRTLRKTVRKPLWIMAYKNDFVDTGQYRIFAEERLADVFVIPDCGEGRRLELQAELAPFGVEMMGFAHVETPREQFRAAASAYKSVYFQLYIGKTGGAEHGTSREAEAAPYLAEAKTFPGLRLFAGFGINTADKARALIRQGFDGVIVGTALLAALNRSETALLELAKALSGAVRSPVWPQE